MLVPVNAINKVLAITRTLVRLVKKKHLLEWVTHSDAERAIDGNSMIGYFVSSKIVYINTATVVYLSIALKLNVFNTSLLLLWTLSPLYVFLISQPYKKYVFLTVLRTKVGCCRYAEKYGQCLNSM